MNYKISSIDELSINTIRTLAMDAVQKANSGHPGMPMGAAPMAYSLWTNFLRFNPKNPEWVNRDRFVLSAGHGSMLLYSLLYLTGYDITIEDIKNFRQFGSKTAGHPEYGPARGIEVTTGPLGQGFANGIGMAVGQKYLAARYNQPGFDIFNYKIFAITSDGDMMEGVSSEAASLAGHLKLGNVIYLYDDNHISIDGSTELAFTEDTAKRFESYGWHVQVISDGNDLEKITEAIQNAINEESRPSLIKIRTHIAYGSPHKQDTAEAHGSALGEEEVKLTKRNLGWDPEKYFYVPEEVLRHYRSTIDKGKELENKWNELFSNYKKQFPGLAKEVESLMNKKFAETGDWRKNLPVFSDYKEKIATRSASGKVINSIAKFLPTLIGGSADLTPSNDTKFNDYPDFQASSYSGRYLRFGVREHSMGAILNGLALTNGIIPYSGTFLIFSDYMRPTIRLAALMKIRPIYIFTHDSIGLGEDGPTHQPVEHLAALRAIPNITVIRPADANETVYAWKIAIEHTTGPAAILLTRQKIPVIDRTVYSPAENLCKGAYVISEAKNDKAEVIIISSGSEVSLCLEAQKKLNEENISARIVSMPSWELFEKQDSNYKESVFPKSVKKRLAVEAATPFGWERYVGDEGGTITVNKFGASAPGEIVMKEYGFTVENVVKHVKGLLKE
ncbi:MAG TPA: transketolase [Ignavibacteria bacterium]|jgi:transketolase